MGDIIFKLALSSFFIGAVVLYIMKRPRFDEVAETEEWPENEDLRLERKLANAKYHRVLYDTLKALQIAGTGASYLSTAIRAEELDKETALATIGLSFRDTMRWYDESTPEVKAHWERIVSIYAKAEELIKGEGV